jgi:hypothetical protein
LELIRCATADQAHEPAQFSSELRSVVGCATISECIHANLYYGAGAAPALSHLLPAADSPLALIDLTPARWI